MEGLLTHIVTISSNFPQIEKAAKEAVDFLNIQQGLLRDPAHELRKKCLFVFQLCLETKRRKFTAIAIAGLQKLIKDDRFHSNNEPSDDSKWLPFQLLQTTGCFFSLSYDIQVDLLKILLNIACSKRWYINGRMLISTLSLCCEAYEFGNAAVQSAAQAAASQTLHSFCFVLKEEQLENESDESKFNEIIPVMQFICSKIDQADYSNQTETIMIFYLECLLTLCLDLPNCVSSNLHLRTFFWQKLCPMLISILGTPKIDKNIITRNSIVEKEHGRGSGGLGTAPSHNISHVKTIYSINSELIRLFGTTLTLRPVLESVFHRVLLYPAPEHRLNALKAAEELLQNPNRLIDLSGPLIQESGAPVSDLSLLRLIMDSIEECSNSTFLIMKASVMCCFGLLKAIEQICLGQCIPSNTAELILKMYPTLPDSDYKGPQTYQSKARLPLNYREIIKKESEILKQMELIQKNLDYETDTSENTEGPEEEDFNNEDFKLDISVNGQIKTSAINFMLHDAPIYLENDARQGARHFFGALYELLPLLFPMRSSIQVDQFLQSFASQYCFIYNEQFAERGTIKADGIYLAIYLILLLDMHLVELDYYSSPKKQIMISEEDFLIKAKGVGVLSYLTSAWLRETYQLIVSSSLLQSHGYLPLNSQPHALINLLTDIEGLGPDQKQSQMLWECRRLVKSSIVCEDSAEKNAGMRLSRRILTCSWETLLKVLAIPLTDKKFKSQKNSLKDFKFLKTSERSKQMKHLVSTSIDGLQILTRLCNSIGLQSRCGNIVELLAAASYSDFSNKTNLMSIQTKNSKSVRLTPSHSRTLDLLLGSGLEIGSHCPDCWPQVFHCSLYVKKLEHKYFSKSENRNWGPMTNIKKNNEFPNTSKNSSLTLDPQIDEDSCVDVYSFLCSSELTQTVSQLVDTDNLGSVEVLKPSDTAKVICVLSQMVDKFFEDAAMKMNLKSLESFSSALCVCSRLQLFPANSSNDNAERFRWFKLRGNLDTVDDEDILLLDFVGEIMLKSIRSGRPLFHIMRIWEIIIPHLMEAVCNKDLTISRKAVQHIHDCINAALTEHPELPNFHSTEMWFKPFEKLLCLELCEPDIQDQIVSCICEFVEANFRDIRSGWRTLFAALGVSLTNINTLLDVFRVFIEIDNITIFAYAAVDYIRCLIKHLKLQSRSDGSLEFGFEILKYLKKCQRILNTSYKMPQAIKFNSAYLIQVSDGLLVDPVIKDFDSLEPQFPNYIPEDLKFHFETFDSLHYLSQFECTPTLDSIDLPSGVLRVWFLLLEGMHSAAISANSAFQPSLLNMLHDDLENLIDEPGPVFGLIIFNRLALPLAQSWLRQLSEMQERDVSGLKQYIGLLSDLVLQYFDRLKNNQTCENLLNLLLSQSLLLLCECSFHPIPAVSKIGPPCIRHIIVNVGKTFSSMQWTIATTALYRMCDLSLKLLRQLMVPFSKDSEDYYGDVSRVKVAVRQAESSHQAFYSNQLCHRVFLWDEQNENFLSSTDCDNQKIYTFLIYESKGEPIRISVTSLVTALQAHHYTLQIIAYLLIGDAKHEMPSLNFILSRNNSYHLKNQTHQENSTCLLNLTNCIAPLALARLLSCLDYSYHCALAFDSRPGLKFLIQKVAGLPQAANLYHQIGVAWAVKSVTLFEYCVEQIKCQNLSIEDVKHRLDSSLFNSEIKLPNLPFFLNKLRNSFNESCKTYLNEVMVNPREDFPVSLKLEKPIFFILTSQENDQLSDENDAKNPADDSEKKQGSESRPEKTLSSDLSENSGLNGHNADGDKNLSEGENENKLLDILNQGEILKNLFPANADIEYNVKNGDGNDWIDEKMNFKNVKEFYTPPEIEQQRRHSFLKDREALCRVWTHMLGSVFELLQRLEDDDFQKVLPIFIDGVGRLMVRVSEPILKQHVSEFFRRIARIYGFGVV